MEYFLHEDSGIGKTNHWLLKKIDDETRFCHVRINGRTYDLKPSTKISYKDVVAMAPGTNSKTLYSVTYHNGPESKPEGILSPDREVQVVDGIVFNIAFTGNA